MTWIPRTAGVDDAPAIAAVHRRSMRAAMPWLPDLHTPDEDRAFFAGELGSSSCWVVVEDASDVVDAGVVGFALVRDGWLRHLYVDPTHQGRGVGSVLLACAVDLVGPGLRLWAFERNVRARAFYVAHGFVQVDASDGSGNEEREPDVLLQLV